jgi:hypothetical protein
MGRRDSHTARVAERLADRTCLTELAAGKKKRDGEVALTKFGDLFRQRKSLLRKAEISV